jgi:hemerythrin superfamily protein
MAPFRTDPSHPTDAIGLLTADHRTIRALFRQYASATDPYTRGMVAKHVFTELDVHAQLEEDVFYPAFESVTTEAGKQLVADSLLDHLAIENLMEALRDIEPDDPEFHAKFQALMHSVEDHMAKEEHVLFLEAEEALLLQAEDLCKAMQELKQQLMTS